MTPILPRIESLQDHQNPSVFGDGPTVCRSPVKDVPCHKGCAEAWINTHAADAADRARLTAAHTPRRGGAR